MLRPRIYLAVAAGILALLLLPRTLSPNVREVLAWIIGAMVYLTSAVRSMLNCPSTVMAASTSWP